MYVSVVSAQLNDSGKYVCVADNSLNRILVAAQLTVQGTQHTHYTTHIHSRLVHTLGRLQLGIIELQF